MLEGHEFRVGVRVREKVRQLGTAGGGALILQCLTKFQLGGLMSHIHVAQVIATTSGDYSVNQKISLWFVGVLDFRVHSKWMLRTAMDFGKDRQFLRQIS